MALPVLIKKYYNSLQDPVGKSVSNRPKNFIWRGTKILPGDMTFSKKLPRVSKWVWDLMWLVISSAHNLITVVQTVRRKLPTTLNNISTFLTSTRIEPELTSQKVMSTFPLYQRGSQKKNYMFDLNSSWFSNKIPDGINSFPTLLSYNFLSNFNLKI